MKSIEEKAEQLYRDAYMRWCYELSHEKNIAIAKSIARYVCDEIIEATQSVVDQEILTPHIIYWEKVKKAIQKLKH